MLMTGQIFDYGMVTREADGTAKSTRHRKPKATKWSVQ